MKQKTDKNADLEQIKSVLEEHPTVLICAFEGLKVEEDHQLRNRVREAGGALPRHSKSPRPTGVERHCIRGIAGRSAGHDVACLRG